MAMEVQTYYTVTEVSDKLGADELRERITDRDVWLGRNFAQFLDNGTTKIPRWFLKSLTEKRDAFNAENGIRIKVESRGSIVEGIANRNIG